ncbi:MAG: DUF3822 family protein [Chitinophagaceae bacterium]|nr:DUF3822 family protein [Chitinophagaceae bacterium]
MNAAYQIQHPENETLDSGQCNLYVEVAAEYLLFGILDKSRNEFTDLNYYRLDKYNTFNHLKDILYGNQLLSGSYNETRIAYHFPDCLVMPYEKYDAGLKGDMLNLVYGDLHKGDILEDSIEPGQWHAVYRVPSALHQVLTAQFPRAVFCHAYTVFLRRKSAEGQLPAGDAAFLVFYEHKLLFAFFRDAKLQLIRTFEYETAEDVTFHLLNACRQLEADCEKIVLHISGLLDDHSSVYAELQKYFLQTELEQRPDSFSYTSAFDEYPAHFFTSLFGIALCAL